MAKLKLDNNCEYDVPQEVIAGYDKMKTDHAAANTALETVNKTVQTLTGERDTLKARVDGIDAEIAKKVAEGVTKARADETEAARVKAIGAAYKVDCEGKDIKAIKVLVLKSYNKDFKEDGKSDDYINAAFDMVPFKTDAVNAPVLNNAIAAQRLAVQAVQQTEKKDAVDPYDAYMATLGSNAAKA